MKTKYILLILATQSLLISNSFADETYTASSNNACKLHNQFPLPNETLDYFGECKDGYANGKAKVNWLKDGKLHQVSEGNFVHGKLEGECKIQVIGSKQNFSGTCANDLPIKGQYVDAEGIIFNGEFKNGKPLKP